LNQRTKEANAPVVVAQFESRGAGQVLREGAPGAATSHAALPRMERQRQLWIRHQEEKTEEREDGGRRYLRCEVMLVMLPKSEQSRPGEAGRGLRLLFSPLNQKSNTAGSFFDKILTTGSG